MQAHIEEILRQKIGLDATTIGSSTIGFAIKQRMQKLNLEDIHEFFLLLERSPQEWQLLIEAVIIPETWFLRDREPFTFLGKFIQKAQPKHPHKVWRILSIPCSTGEEPYSIVLSLLEAGLLAHQFSIDAFDISYQSLEKARQGIYTKNSFRGVNQEIIDRYFRVHPEGYVLNENIKSKVNFTYGNILEFNRFNSYEFKYDIAFCRNLLIYFDADTRNRAIAHLAKSLTREGLLFVGHAESGCLLNSSFVSGENPKAFVFRKADQVSIAPIPSPALELKTIKKIEVPEAIAQSLLNQAQIKADSNDFVSALHLCQEYLKQNPLDSDAHALMGNIYQAQGEISKAITFFQKALYLNPNHYSSLVQLMLIKQEQGDRSGVILLKQRIDRLSEVIKTSSERFN